MRIAAISDIHGNLDAFEAVLTALEREKPDKVVILGDLVAFGPDPVEVIDRIRELPNAVVIRGNTDRFILEVESPSHHRIWEAIWWTKYQLGESHLNYIKKLPEKKSFTVEGVSILLCHGDPISDDGGFFPGKEQSFKEKLSAASETVVLCGHTHRPLWRRIDDQYVINDGSAGFPYDGDPRPCYAVFDALQGKVSQIRIERVEYNTYAVSQKLGHIQIPMAELMSRRVVVGKMLSD
jgi:putative phosphoesterase